MNVLHTYIYNDNKNIYNLTINAEWKKKCLRLFNKKTPLYAGLGSKQQNF